jgi:DNA-binding CsgD family transcriptional regulator
MSDSLKYWDIITKQETQIIKLLAGGYNQESIANQLNVSRNTVCWHLANLRRKTNVPNLIDLLRKFYDFVERR